MCSCLVLLCDGDRRRADFVLTARSCCGHMPRIAGSSGVLTLTLTGECSQQPSSFGAWLFVHKVCQVDGVMPILNCLWSMQST